MAGRSRVARIPAPPSCGVGFIPFFLRRAQAKREINGWPNPFSEEVAELLFMREFLMWEGAG